MKRLCLRASSSNSRDPVFLKNLLVLSVDAVGLVRGNVDLTVAENRGIPTTADTRVM